MAQPPSCDRCGREHYRFVRCADVSSWNEKHGAAQERANPKIENWKVPEGYRVWGHRTTGNTAGAAGFFGVAPTEGFHVAPFGAPRADAAVGGESE